MFFNFLVLASAVVSPIDSTTEIDELRVQEAFLDEEVALGEEFNDDLGMGEFLFIDPIDDSTPDDLDN